MLGELTFDPLFNETGIPLAVMGMLLVFVALSILVGVITAMPHIIALLEGNADAAEPTPSHAKSSATKSPTTAPSVGPNSDPNSDPELSPELIAVIAAAAEAELGAVRVVRMRPLTPSEIAWTLEGRLRHHASHRLQPRNR
ncbi:sodium pump decarboxylases, gamma subunit [Neorhodopirellula lusitana]|uniref:Sodium pump decarboxylases, gamma subunit n=1 Tax=Neorhodopirellula lusitana TaxID=445327 RepID=A0ABY1QCQ4_9BACT|nr:OadG family protein [Neorhodopirellula lusitana]SMP67496.1 sodium pump decarboxylases, gamma subunit [Neorhodopirellula lusitana]